MSDTECLGGHTFVMPDEVFSNGPSPWRTRCDCAAREIVIEYNRHNYIWRVKMPAPESVGDDRRGRYAV